MNIYKHYSPNRQKYHSNILFTFKSNYVFYFLTFRQLVNYNITLLVSANEFVGKY